MTNSTSATTEMRKLREEFSRRLMSNPDYRALIALDKAIAEVEGAPDRPLSTPDSHVTSSPEPPKHFSLEASAGHFISHANAAIAVLKRSGRPMPLSALLPLVREEGAKVNGEDPGINLSSSLSRRKDQLRSVRYDGRSCWWLTGRPFPGEKDFGGATGARTPAADKRRNIGERYASP